MSASIACLIVAAGAARRFGSPKQLALFKGKTLLAWAIHHAQTAGFHPILVVSGAHREAVECQLGKDLLHHHHAAWQEGMPSSIQAGLAQLLALPNWEHSCILPADMPFFDASWLQTYAAALTKSETPPLVVATDYGGLPGLPAIISRALAESMQGLNPRQPLRPFLTAQLPLISFADGPHTKDIDQAKDLHE